ncbi:MAG: tetratricopeptide repeat protein [Flavobacteriales bacterium]|nr:tetratricopeptide repeat protein [Flavobacteriales bacterium]
MIFRRISELPNYAIHLILMVLAAAVYYPMMNAEFVRWDDTHYILQNLLVRHFSWEAVKDIFTTKQVMGTYSPIILLSWMIDYKIAGYDPRWFHAVNFGWHLLNITLVYGLIKRWFANKEVALVSTLLFAVHPMNVEVVAWATGRKDLMFVGLLLLSLWFYHKYAIGKRPLVIYGLTLLFFVLAVLAKAVAVVLPVILLLLDVFVYRKKFSFKLVLEKLPFFVIALAGGIWAIVAQKDVGAIQSANDIPVWMTPFLFTYRIAQYLIRFVWPPYLSNFYPFDEMLGQGLPWYVFASLPAVLFLFFLLWRYGRKLPLTFFGVLFFTVCLLPVLQLIPLGNSLIADRYVYLPYIGLFISLVLVLVEVGKTASKPMNLSLNVIVLVWIIALGFRANLQARVWESDRTLWSNYIEHYPDDDMGYGKLGIYYADHGEMEEAMDCFNKEVEKDPDFYSGYTNRGLAYEEMGDFDRAFADLNKAIELRDDFAMSRINRGLAYLNTGQLQKALADLEKAIELEPQNPAAHYNLALTMERLQKVPEALDHYSKAIEIDPKNPELYYHRGRLYALTFKLNEGLADIDRALELNGNDPKYYVLRSEIYISKGDKRMAKENALQAKARGGVVSEQYMRMLDD